MEADTRRQTGFTKNVLKEFELISNQSFYTILV